MKHFTQLNSNHLNNNNQFKPLIHKNKQFHYPHLYEIQSRQINRINDKINMRKNVSCSHLSDYDCLLK